MYNAAVVGCGVIGSRFAETFADHDDTVLWGACDVVAERAESFADEHDCRAFTDHREMVTEDAVDLVYVGVPPVHHRDVVADSLDAGKHVICEKPIAEDAEVGAEMVALAAESDLVTAVDLPFRYTPGFVELRERVADGYVGDPRRVELDFRFPEWPREWQDVDWLESREQGGPLREVGTHFLFGVQELFGPVDHVSADVQFTAPSKYEESIVGYFGVDGIHGTIDLLTDHDEPEANVVTVVGDDGSLSLTEWYKLVEDRHQDDEQVLNEHAADTTAMLVDEFVTELDGGDGDLVSFAAANRVQRVVDAIFAADGRRVELN